MEQLPMMPDLEDQPRSFLVQNSLYQTPLHSILVQAVTYSPQLCRMLTMSHNAQFYTEVIEHIQGLTLSLIFIGRPGTSHENPDSHFIVQWFSKLKYLSALRKRKMEINLP